MAGRLFCYIGSPAFDSTDARSLGAGGALLLNDAIHRAPNLDGYLIGRDTVAFPDNVPFGATEADAYQNGKNRALEMFNRYPMRLSARVGPNEPGVETLEKARLQGAFEAGVGDVCWGMAEDYVGGNWAYGCPDMDGDPTHAALVVEWLRAYWRWSPNSDLTLGYHGYRKSRDAAQALAEAQWFERRPFDWWLPALRAAGLETPPVMMTEAGFDAGAVEGNGYQGQIGSEAYAEYLQGLPTLVPEAIAFCVYLYTTIDPGKWATFDFSGDTVVKAAIVETNRMTGGETMPNDLAHEIWDMAFRWPELPKPGGYNPNTAIGAYREAHTILGMPLSNEYTRDTWPVVMQVYGGGVVLSRRGDWRTIAAYKEQDVRDALAGPLA